MPKRFFSGYVMQTALVSSSVAENFMTLVIPTL